MHFLTSGKVATDPLIYVYPILTWVLQTSSRLLVLHPVSF